MCGLAGFMRFGGESHDRLMAQATAMALAIRHRGPDDAGAWADERSGIALGHCRLSIIDLSQAGHQPMQSDSGRWLIAYNGEIYNHLELRAQLESAGAAPEWRGHSDTETMLAGFEYWGVDATLAKCAGMFAIALWDRREKVLALVRDRFGEKPLYYGWTGKGDATTFVFGSELKALRAFPGFNNIVCREALQEYMRFVVVPAPRSIYRGIYKLEPGCVLRVREMAPLAAPQQLLRAPADYESISIRRWWSLSDVVVSGAQEQINDEHAAVEMLDERLKQAVRLQSLADVPVGAFLSGGVDSSIIVALMQQQSTQGVKTFTVGFEEADFDESPHARAVASHLGTDHTEIYVTAAEAQAVIAQLPMMYDEPFADSSQIPTHLVCQAARAHVKVALSGDAGDELFGGYNRYMWNLTVWNRLALLPYPLRRVLGAAIAAVPTASWDALGRGVNPLLPKTAAVARPGDKVHRLAARLRWVRNTDDLYQSLLTEWQDPAQVVRAMPGEQQQVPERHSDALPSVGVEQIQLHMMYRDSMAYLPDDILCKVDRAAMAISLETRVPFLDPGVVELAWRLPLNMKIRDGKGKWALRQVLYRYVPRALIDRPKVGFGIPIGQWLRGPLRAWAEALLDEKRLETEGYFHPAPIRTKWIEHLSGRRDHMPSLWAVLMFQAWLEQQGNSR